MQTTSSRSSPARWSQGRKLDQSIPPLLRPVLRAYILGYASSAAPRLLTLLLTHLSKRRKNIDEKPEDCFLPSLLRILKGGLELQRFPTFCAALVGGSTFLEIPLRRLFSPLGSKLSHVAQLRLAKWLSTFISAWFSLRLLQSKSSTLFMELVTEETANGPVIRPKRFAGRTLDLTLFAVTRAVDVIVGELWSQRRACRIAAGKWTVIENHISCFTDASLFATSCALIMWAFIYVPDRLPRAYNKWINSAASVDQRLLILLRRVRFGQINYGVETYNAKFLEGMCKDYHWPLDYADPVKSIPFPCEMVHMGTGKSCEYHALSRFRRSFLWAFSTYLPLNLALLIRNPTKEGIKRAFKSSARSSAFLATFITLYYYGICLTRTRIGPRILGTSTPMRQSIDSGYCIAAGCAACGWSILLENPSRRTDISLFVTPRALATVFPRRYEWEKQWRETMAFAMSTAVVFTCVGEKPARVRGVLGKILHGVLCQ